MLAAVALAVSGPAQRHPERTQAREGLGRQGGGALPRQHAGGRPRSYIDPRVFDRFDGGLTIAGVLPELVEDTAAWPDLQGTIEEAVLDLIEKDTSSPAIESVA